MKVVFMGTPDFAVPSLEMLVNKHQVLAVFTQPDKPKGRGKKLAFSPVKEKALSYGLTVYQPEKIKELQFVELLNSLDADIFVVVAFGQILPESILNIPPKGCINVHGSLLPKYRGAGPIQWAVINGEKVTGVTTMYMEKGLDSGNMILKKEMEITEEDTYGSVSQKMSLLGAKALEETLEAIEKGQAPSIPQNPEEATYAPKIEKEFGHIVWDAPSGRIMNLIRGLDPQPSAYTFYQEEPIKIWKARIWNGGSENGQPGEVIQVNKNSFVIKTADGALEILELQAKGGKRMDTGAYLRGHEIILNSFFS